jgi:tagatose-6-phosphate ketose/aldose isomerase
LTLSFPFDILHKLTFIDVKTTTCQMVLPTEIPLVPERDLKLESWLGTLAGRGEPWAALLQADESAQRARGYFHTLREISQQPLLWPETAGLVGRLAQSLRGFLERAGIGRDAGGTILLTGSGSSLYAAECAAPSLQEAFGVPVRAVSPEILLTQPRASVPATGPVLVVSLARSGNSPESCGAVDRLLEAHPRCAHLVLTCSAEGGLARRYKGEPRVECVVLDDRTNDRSLVMTSSFTNLVVAAAALGHLEEPERYRATIEGMAHAAAGILERSAAALQTLALHGFPTAVFLGSGSRKGAALESGLKLLEMTCGRVSTLAEGFLGLRHGPMAAVHPDSVVVCFFSDDPATRAYECDLVRELDRKKLGGPRLLAGSALPEDLAREGDVVVDWEGSSASDDVPVLPVVAGQLLAFFRCLEGGAKPDAPSPEGVISRVVEDFQIHR